MPAWSHGYAGTYDLGDLTSFGAGGAFSVVSGYLQSDSDSTLIRVDMDTAAHTVDEDVDRVDTIVSAIFNPTPGA